MRLSEIKDETKMMAGLLNMPPTATYNVNQINDLALEYRKHIAALKKLQEVRVMLNDQQWNAVLSSQLTRVDEFF